MARRLRSGSATLRRIAPTVAFAASLAICALHLPGAGAAAPDSRAARPAAGPASVPVPRGAASRPVTRAAHEALVAEYKLATTRIEFGPSERDTCLKCHVIPNFVLRDSATLVVKNLSVSRPAFLASVHGKLACNQCHADVKRYPHEFTTARPQVSCDADCHARDAKGQPVRHDRELADFRRGAHRKGLTGENPDSPSCTYCHGAGDPHAATPVKNVLRPRDKMALCAPCHDDRQRMVRNHVNPEAVASYRRSFHYKAIRLGAAKSAVCQDCHLVHRVIGPRDTASTVSVLHLAQTCAQKDCHPNARINFAMSGANHLDLRLRRDPVLAIWDRFFVWVTVGTVLALGAGVLFDAQRRFWRVLPARRRPAAAEPGASRAPGSSPAGEPGRTPGA